MEGFGVGVGVEKCPGLWEEKPEEVFFRQKEKYLEVTLPDIKASFTFGFSGHSQMDQGSTPSLRSSLREFITHPEL